MKNFVKLMVFGTTCYLVGKCSAPKIVVAIITKDEKPE